MLAIPFVILFLLLPVLPSLAEVPSNTTAFCCAQGQLRTNDSTCTPQLPTGPHGIHPCPHFITYAKVPLQGYSLSASFSSFHSYYDSEGLKGVGNSVSQQRFCQHWIPNSVPRATPRRVYDMVSFSQELQVLKVRLQELRDVVYTHIVVESSISHAGGFKPAVLWDHREEFKQYNIRHFVAELTDSVVFQNAGPSCFGEFSWKREELQRDLGYLGLFDASPEDIVIVTDLDEVPCADVVHALSWCDPAEPQGTLPLNFHYYNFACWKNGFWGKSKFVTFDYLWNHLHKRLCSLRFIDTPLHTHAPSGWHMSFFGGISVIQLKLRRFAHTEYNRPEYTDATWLRKALRDCIDLFKRGGNEVMLKMLDISFLPRVVGEHPWEYRHLLSSDLVVQMKQLTQLKRHCYSNVSAPLHFSVMEGQALSLQCCEKHSINFHEALWGPVSEEGCGKCEGGKITTSTRRPISSRFLSKATSCDQSARKNLTKFCGNSPSCRISVAVGEYLADVCIAVTKKLQVWVTCSSKRQ